MEKEKVQDEPHFPQNNVPDEAFAIKLPSPDNEKEKVQDEPHFPQNNVLDEALAIKVSSLDNEKEKKKTFKGSIIALEGVFSYPHIPANGLGYYRNTTVCLIRLCVRQIAGYYLGIFKDADIHTKYNSDTRDISTNDWVIPPPDLGFSKIVSISLFKFISDELPYNIEIKTDAIRAAYDYLKNALSSKMGDYYDIYYSPFLRNDRTLDRRIENGKKVIKFRPVIILLDTLPYTIMVKITNTNLDGNPFAVKISSKNVIRAKFVDKYIRWNDIQFFNAPQRATLRPAAKLHSNFVRTNIIQNLLSDLEKALF